jgi:septum site-determining protein MinD
MHNVWLVASGKGGTGKSAVVVNLGAALAAEGLRVALVDLNVGLRCLDLCLGLDDRVLFDLMDVLDGKCRLQDALLRRSANEKLWLLPAAQNRSMNDVSVKSLKALCELLSKEFDLVLLDCPSGLEPIPVRAAAVAGKGIVVTTTDAASIRDTERLVAEFAARGLADLYLVINRFRSDLAMKNIIPGETEIADAVGIPLLGTIPEDEAVLLANLKCEPIFASHGAAPAARIFTALARRLPGKDFL